MNQYAREAVKNTDVIEFYDQNGYAIVNLLDEVQYQKLLDLVCDRLSELSAQEGIFHTFSTDSLENYHLLNIPDSAHSRMMAPNNRTISLSKSLQEVTLNENAYRVQKYHWGHSNGKIQYLSDGREVQNVCGFRIIRPNSKDSSGIHSESSSETYPVSIWIPLKGFDKRYTLNLAPKTHKLTHPPEAIQKALGFLARPYTESYVKQFKFIRPEMSEGQAILFHPNLIHGGSTNSGDYTRVSIEIRIHESGIFKRPST